MPDPLPHFDTNQPSMYDVYRELGELSTKADEMLENQSDFKKQFIANDKRIAKLEQEWAKVAALGVAVSLVVTWLVNTVKIHITQ